MKNMIASTLFTVVAAPTLASDINVSVEIPRLDVAEYHKPYVAVWIENSKNKVVSNLAVWYDVDMRNNEGEKWLKDMRQWWRRTGRNLDLPVDGMSGATQGPGTHQLNFSLAEAKLTDLPAGKYRLRVEAAREVGGRELINIPFNWPQANTQTFNKSGKTELSAISFTINP
ncbi:DUF2271 domain-containing protein [Pseudoalteromonas phenolica]|uniref:DUF2271 domain-containing protein n=1 Tax=Pseudoalteromonas phenolica TaxID=161398 RepID=A0A5S3YXN8_9GAMM|nr:DUF2271 domain-containing protein [Pseudoalteromonas phenolica]TMP82262.1 DUF2271 domain-containing protein [Pseudoalteromonas phenolica]